MNCEEINNYAKKVKSYLKNTKLNDLSRLMQITRMDNIGRGKALLIAGVVAWSAFTCSFGNVNSASAASIGLLGQAGEMPKEDYEYVSETGDLLRYTQVVKHDEMADMVRSTVELLEEKGYTVNEVDNKYLNEDGRYKAVHLNATSPSGQQFEIQVHSAETLAASRATHTLYEEWRKPETTAQRKAELYTQIKGTYDSLPLPKNIMNLKSFKLAS